MGVERARRLPFCSSVRTIRPGVPPMSPPDPSRRPMAEETTPYALDQEDGEENEEVEDRKAEQPPGESRRAWAGAFDPQAPRQYHHQAACEQRGRAIDRIRIAQEPRRGAHGDQRYRIEQDLAPRLFHPPPS